MDFEDTPDEATYRARARAWLRANAPIGLPRRRVREDFDAPQLAAARAWQALKASEGYACITWPDQWGGPGGSAIEAVIFAQEEEVYDVPGNPFHIGLDMCMPTVLTYCDEAIRERFAGPALRGDTIWCQLFSEPSGGSDLAAVRTRAVSSTESSDEWIVNGQKIWTTGAQLADFGLLLCRTDPTVAKHSGLTMFWIDMKASGVEVRPIYEMDGSASFNEVFLTDVHLHDDQRLCAVGDGWKLALHTLMNERLSADQTGLGWEDFFSLAQRVMAENGKPAMQGPALRGKLADWYIAQEGLRHTRNRALTALSKGQAPGPEGSIVKLVRANQMQDLARGAIEMLGPFGIVDDPDHTFADGLVQSSLLWSAGLRIAGGTDEILRNVIAERILGLPGDVRVDKGIAFKDIPVGI